MSIVKAKAYIASAGEYDALREKYPAFISADVSEKAKEQGAYVSSEYENKGYYFLRTPLSGSSRRVAYGYYYGVRDWNCTHSIYAGLRVALPLIYNPKSSLVRGCREIKRTTEVWNEKTKKDVKVTSKAPVVKFGGVEYIWTNKEDCENAKSQIMNLVSLELVEKAVPFDREGNHNDYAKAEELRAQCERVAFENATEEEKAMAVEVTMSSEDGYEKVEYNFVKEQEEIPLKEIVDELYLALAKGMISVEDWKQQTLNRLDIMSQDESTYSDEDLMRFGDYVVQKFEQFKTRSQAKANAEKLILQVAQEMEEEEKVNE